MGFATDNSKRVPAGIALLLIDVINDLDFPEGEELLKHAVPMAAQIAKLKRAASQKGIPCIYVNDNFGHWRSDLRAQVGHCLASPRGKKIASLVKPDDEDYFVLKPMHSGFHGTVLELLLKHLQVNKLVLCGLATNICVLFTANDAYMRGYELWIPHDCVAANDKTLHQSALREMETVLKADTRGSEERHLNDWTRARTAKRDQLVHSD
jgi:nicotinamidase-related amidase